MHFTATTAKWIVARAGLVIAGFASGVLVVGASCVLVVGASCVLVVGASCVLVGCASGVASDSSHPDLGVHDGGPHDGGDSGPHDGGHTDGMVTGDGAMADASPDFGLGDMCMGVTCMPFESCMAGHCTPYPACTPAGGCTESTDICRSRHCVPRTSDIDHDGVTAATDCDETNPMIHPGATDVCNGVDDDCNGIVDDGPPATLCPPGMGMCIMGHCGCPAGLYDLDGMPGCECTGMPAATVAAACASAQDMGDVPDTAAMATVSGNALPAGREVWYHFHASDSADTGCDLFSVHVFFTSNPGTAFEFTVYRGACGMVECGDTGIDDYTYSMHMMTAGPIGECPCGPSTPGVNTCNDDSADFWVRVRRKAGAAVACASYVLEVSNGV